MKTIIHMYEHLNWANNHILDALEKLNLDESHQTIRLFSHILFAEQVWLCRLQEKDSSGLPIWGESHLVEWKKLIEKNKHGFATFITNLKESDLDRSITYKNSRGEEFQSSVRDILTHVSLHGHYHRGQINQLLRADGFEPVPIDYITFVR